MLRIRHAALPARGTILLLLVLCAGSWLPANAQLVINEIMQNPDAVGDNSGEWLELHNPTGSPIDIEGWRIEDAGVDSHIINSGGPLLVPAGGYVVLGNNADTGTNGGAPVDYSYGSNWFLANGDDEVILLDGSLTEIDRVEYDGGPSFPDPTGASMALRDPAADNNVGTNWCESPTPFGAGDLGTPGAANDCPPPGTPELVINEILQNPAAVGDNSGEWFELFNPTASDIDIDGFTIQDNDSDLHVIANGGPLLVPAGGYLVLGNNDDPGTNGGAPVDYNYGGNWFLANGADEVVILDGSLTEIDRVEYDGGPSFPDPTGASMALDDPAADNNDGANWCESSTPFGDGDLGTPGAANDCGIEPTPPLVINEIMQNPAAVGDGDGEWFELYNPNDADVDIDGWTIADAGADSHVISNGGPLMVPAGGYLVLGNNADPGTNGGAPVAYSYGGNWFLSNGADEVVLLDGSLTEVDRVEYDDGATFPDPTGASMALIEPAADNNDGANWCESSTPYGDGDFGTPGGFNDCIDLPQLVVNEIDYDPPGSDVAEFLEIKNVGAEAVDLDSVAVELVNGANLEIYDVIDLPASVLLPGDYFVVCDSAVNVANCDLEDSSMSIQNGAPDAAALTFGGVILDTVSYEGDVPGYTEGSGDGLEDDSGVDFAGISRLPDGVDSDQNNIDLSLRCVSPGLPNLAEDSDCDDPRGGLVVNEIDYDQDGGDDAEFIEIFNNDNEAVDLDAYALELVNGSTGAVYDTIDLPAEVLGADDYYVVCGDALTVANCDFEDSSMSIQNGAPDAVALVLAGVIVDTVSYEGDVAGYVEGSGDGLEDDPDVIRGGISRFPNGIDTSRNNLDLSQRCITPGAANTSVADACDFSGDAFEIFDIQGAGLSSPFEGQVVTTLDNVVTGVGPTGFFIQTPELRSDADPETSEGIFVFTGAPPAVAVGDQVDVRGGIAEFFDLTEFGDSPLVAVDSAGNPLPAAEVFDENTPSPNQPQPDTEMERFEGMRVAFSGLATGPSDRFGDTPVVAQAERSFREPGIEYPGLPDLPVWDGNPEIFELDADGLGLPDEPIFAGQTVTADGPLTFSFGDYQVLPNSLVLGPEPALPLPVRSRESGEMTVGSLNLFRLFDDVADGGEEVVDTDEYLRRLTKFSLYVRDVLGAPDVLAVQEAEKLGVLEDLAAKIAADDAALIYSAYLVEGNDVGGIDVGFLTRDSIQVDAVAQLGADEILTYDGSLLHDRPPLLVEGAYLDNGAPFAVAVMVVHNRSLGGIDDPSDGERVRQKRFEQAESIAVKVQAIQMADPAVRLVVTGDFNAFQFTDGYVDVVGEIKGDFVPEDNLLSGDDLVDPNLANGVDELAEEERYSFVFGGSAQTLDHSLAAIGLGAFGRGMEFGRGNADAPNSLLGDDATPLRSSDHDGLVLFVMSDSDADGVPDDLDACPDTVIPESVPLDRLRPNRWALTDDDGVFDTVTRGGGNDRSFTVEDTAGCSCEQIIDALGLGRGHSKFGCSTSAMTTWVLLVNP